MKMRLFASEFIDLQIGSTKFAPEPQWGQVNSHTLTSRKVIGEHEALQTRSKKGRDNKAYIGYGVIIEPVGNHDKFYHPDFSQVFGYLPRIGLQHLISLGD